MGRRAGAVALAGLLVLAGCGGDDADGDATDDGEDAAAERPSECPPVEGPVTVEIDGGEELPGIEGPSFEATSRVVGVTPIVLEDVPSGDIEAAQEAAAATDLLSYSVYLADFELDEGSASSFGPGEPPEGGTYLAVSIVPPTEAPLETGDVIPAGTPEFESTTTFANLGVTYQTAVSEDEPLLATDTEGSGEAEVLYLDDDELCLRVTQSGTYFGGPTDGTWSVDTVVGGPLAPRDTLGFN